MALLVNDAYEQAQADLAEELETTPGAHLELAVANRRAPAGADQVTSDEWALLGLGAALVRVEPYDTACARNSTPVPARRRYRRVVGRASREKRERRQHAARTPGSRPLAQYNRTSLTALLAAASASPSAAGYLVTIGAAFHAVITRARDGRARATADAFAEIIDGVIDDDRRLATLISDAPLDARRGVVTRWHGELFRLIPGTWERPVSNIENAAHAAAAANRAVYERHGFGIGDIVELSLRYQDSCARRLANVWPDGDEPDLTQAEVNAGGHLESIEDVAARCRRPASARAALDWATRRPEELTFEPDHPSAAVFGPVLAVVGPDGRDAIPVGFFAEATATIVKELLHEAMADPDVATSFQDRTEDRVLHLLSVSSGEHHPHATVDGRHLTDFIKAGDGLYLAVASESAALYRAQSILESVVPGSTVTTSDDRTVEIEHDATVVRLLVAHGVDELFTTGSEEDAPVTVMLGEDLRWIVQTSERDDDLVTFLYDHQRPFEGFRFSFGPFDMWEQWRHNEGSTHRQGIAPTAIFFSPHSEAAEWEKHAQLVWLEQLLLDVSVPALPFWPKLTVADRDVTAIDPGEMVQLFCIPDPMPVAVRAHLQGPDPALVASIADVIQFKFARCGDALLDAARAAGRDTLLITVGIQRFDDGVSFAVHATPDLIAVGVDPRASQALHPDPKPLVDLLGAKLAAAVTDNESARVALEQRWAAVPPAITVDSYNLQQAARHLRPYQAPHPHFASDVSRRLGERLAAAGVRPGTWSGDAAKRFESETVHPILREMLEEGLSRFDRVTLLTIVGELLERAHSTRFQEDAEQARRATLPVDADDLVATVHRSRTELNASSRTLALLVEELMRSGVAGGGRPHHFDLSELIAIAEAVLASGLRSESLHHATQDATITVDDAYEISVDTRAGPSVDVEAFQRAQAAVTIGRRPQPLRQGRRPNLTDALPDLAPVDQSLESSLGFGVDELLDTLDALIGWDVADAAPVAVVERTEVVRAAVALRNADEAAVDAAVSFLQLSADRLGAGDLEHWELDRRAVRLATSPIVTIDDDCVMVLPWTAWGSRRVLVNHLGDGRLPWPMNSLPQPVRTALERYRQRRNTDLEKEVVDALSAAGFVVRGNLKKPALIGLTSDPGEIDAICIDSAQARIWVLEAKDPVMALSPHQMRNNVESFHAPDGYVAKLKKKTAAVAADAAAVAATLGAPTAAGPWDVVGMMVTRRIEPAAFHTAPQVPFCLSRDVAAIVSDGSTPEAGYVQVRH